MHACIFNPPESFRVLPPCHVHDVCGPGIMYRCVGAEPGNVVDCWLHPRAAVCCVSFSTAHLLVVAAASGTPRAERTAAAVGGEG